MRSGKQTRHGILRPSEAGMMAVRSGGALLAVLGLMLAPNRKLEKSRSRAGEHTNVERGPGHQSGACSRGDGGCRMMRRLILSNILLAIALALFATPAGAVTVYDNLNLTAFQGQVFFAGASPIRSGDQVTLAGTARTVTDFTFTYNTSGFDGDETFVLWFFKNDGAGGEPGTLLFASASQALTSGVGVLRTVSGLSVTVPDTFTWAIEVLGYTGDDSLAWRVFDPPTVGSSSSSSYWTFNGASWTQSGIAPGFGNFGARIEAAVVAEPVPEPGTLLLLGSGLLGAAGYGSRRRETA